MLDKFWCQGFAVQSDSFCAKALYRVFEHWLCTELISEHSVLLPVHPFNIVLRRHPFEFRMSHFAITLFHFATVHVCVVTSA